MNTITDKLAAALRRIRDQHPATYAHVEADMLADVREWAAEALAEYDALRAQLSRYATRPADAWRAMPAQNGARMVVMEGGRYVAELPTNYARRAVACVNACAGIPTAQLEVINARHAIDSLRANPATVRRALDFAASRMCLDETERAALRGIADFLLELEHAMSRERLPTCGV